MRGMPCNGHPQGLRRPGSGRAARRRGTKKGDSFRNLPRSPTLKMQLFCNLFGGSGSLSAGIAGLVARSGRVALLGAALAGSVRSRSLNSGSLRSIGSLLVRITAAAYHGNSCQNNDKRENLFHSVNIFYLARQRYTFAGKKQSEKTHFLICRKISPKSPTTTDVRTSGRPWGRSAEPCSSE